MTKEKVTTNAFAVPTDHGSWRTAAILDDVGARRFIAQLSYAKIEHRVEGSERGVRITVPAEKLDIAMQLRQDSLALVGEAETEHKTIQARYVRLLFSIPAGAYIGSAFVYYQDIDSYYANRICAISAIICAFVVDWAGEIWTRLRAK